MNTHICLRPILTHVRKGFFSTFLFNSNNCTLLNNNEQRASLLLSHLRCASHVTDQKHLGKEIYNGPMASRIRSVKLFSLTTSFFGLMIQPVMVQKILEEEISVGVIVFSGLIIQFFTFATPILLHQVCKKYVRAIYFSSETDSYTALTYNFWTGDKLLSFKAEDVVVPDIPGMFTSVIVKKTPIFMEVSHFSDINHYKRIMGFDKPMDFKLYEKPESKS